MKEVYAQETLVECTDNGKSITAEVDRFQPGQFLSVVMNTVTVNLQYQSRFDQYVGSMGGMEFVSKGPKTVGTYR
jgi:hypothetical protein